MKKLLALAAFALVSLAATSAHAQSTISPVPGAKDAPHQTDPSNIPSEDPYGKMKSQDQTMKTKHRANYTKNSGNSSMRPERSSKRMMKRKDMSTSGSTM